MPFTLDGRIKDGYCLQTLITHKLQGFSFEAIHEEISHIGLNHHDDDNLLTSDTYQTWLAGSGRLVPSYWVVPLGRVSWPLYHSVYNLSSGENNPDKLNWTTLPLVTQNWHLRTSVLYIWKIENNSFCNNIVRVTNIHVCIMNYHTEVETKCSPFCGRHFQNAYSWNEFSIFLIRITLKVAKFTISKEMLPCVKLSWL